MKTRNPNRAQYWFCEICERKTEHEIGNPSLDVGDGIASSRWVTLNGITAYERVRQCTECTHPTTTLEIRAEEVRELAAAANRVGDLGEFKNSVQVALSKIT